MVFIQSSLFNYHYYLNTTKIQVYQYMFIAYTNKNIFDQFELEHLFRYQLRVIQMKKVPFIGKTNKSIISSSFFAQSNRKFAEAKTKY